MRSKTSICNLALSHIGVSVPIANVDEERSKEASTCRVFYDEVRAQTFRDFWWPFATAFGPLALVAEEPTSEWRYAYRYPAGCMTFRRILSGVGRVDSSTTRVRWRLGRDSAGQLIYTDQPNAVGEWTALVEDPEQYPPDFAAALSLLLAASIAPRLTAGDQFKIGARAFDLYRLQVARAQENSANEESRDDPPESEFITVRA